MATARKKLNKSSSKKSAVEAVPVSSRKSVDIKKAANGYVVSTWGDKGEQCYVAKTKKEAEDAAMKLLK